MLPTKLRIKMVYLDLWKLLEALLEGLPAASRPTASILPIAQAIGRSAMGRFLLPGWRTIGSETSMLGSKTFAGWLMNIVSIKPLRRIPSPLLGIPLPNGPFVCFPESWQASVPGIFLMLCSTSERHVAFR